jgi:hypothetical protein
MVADGLCGAAKGHDFSVGRWIVIQQVAVEAPPDYLPIAHHHRPYRHLPCLQRPLGLAERLFHPELVGSRRRHSGRFHFSLSG